MVNVLPVQNRIADQKLEKCIVSGRDRPSHIGFIGIGNADQKLSLSHELLRQVGNHMANLIHEVQVGMKPDLIGTDQAKEIDPNIFRQPLQFRSGDLRARKTYVDEHGRVLAPVKTDTIIDFLYDGIVRVPHLEPMDPV
jgi:hypothetical protein